MKKWVLGTLTMAGLAAWFLKRMKRRPLARKRQTAHRTVDPMHVADYVEMAATTYRVRTSRDVLPGGLSAAMAPVFVVWDRSSFGAGTSITIRNLNHGGNPIAGTTVLRTATLRSDRVQRVEYLNVPLAGNEAISHGQLRFVFEPGSTELIDSGPSTVGEPDAFNDLILSWEAWRPPGTSYNILKGMDPTAYQLSLRAYSGVQRFVEDALRGRSWEAYPLALPGGPEGMAELLKVSLAMGDGAGRSVVSEVLKPANDDWVKDGPRGERDGNAAQMWQDLQGKLEDVHTLGDARIDLEGLTGYHSALRSCASMALYQIDVAIKRIVEQGHRHEGGSLRLADIAEIPDWMKDLSGTNVAGLFLRGRRMIAFANKYPGAIPGNIPKQLDEAGLLVREDGKPVKRQFTVTDETPWGPAKDLLTR